MRISQLFTRTRKQLPANEEARNAQLLIQAGFIHKEMAGVYAYLPLGKIVLEKISNIIREEMNAIGAQELQMTTLQPKELWQRTDRWDDEKVDNWFKTKLANGSELGVGLTHEEPVVNTMRDYIESYKDLPVLVYQIQSKFRNELRAKSGLLRGREFIMKDMYSFARSQEEHSKLYEEIAKVYDTVYKRLGIGGITFRVKADGGYFTDKFSDEFQTVTPIGEDTLFKVPGTTSYFNGEVAPAQAPTVPEDDQLLPLKEVVGKGIIGVNDLTKFLKIPVEKTTKTMLYSSDDGRVIAAAVRGGYDINEIKLRKAAKAKSLKLADEDTVRRITGAEVGYAGLLNLSKDVEVFVDESCANRTNFEVGGNKTNVHIINVNWGRDLPEPKKFYDIKLAKAGDLDPSSGKVYEITRAVEVGNIFSLESKYSDALDVYYVDETGKRRSIIMGCYGIGVSRLMGVIAEHFSDQKGLVWPNEVAPAQVYLIRLGDGPSVVKAADELYSQLQDSNIEVLYDDRDVRAGQKFADADLMGIPYRVVISDKTVEKESVELKARTEEEPTVIRVSELLTKVRNN